MLMVAVLCGVASHAALCACIYVRPCVVHLVRGIPPMGPK